MLQQITTSESRVGIVWNYLVVKLPDRLQQAVPVYRFPDRLTPLYWLRSHAHEAATCSEIARAWPRWTAFDRSRWFLSLPPKVSNAQPGYRSLALAIPPDEDLYLQESAARFLTSCEPFDDAAAEFVARIIRKAPELPRFRAHDLLLDLVGAHITHPAVTNALAELSRNESPEGDSATLVLAALDPAAFPLAQLLAPRMKRLRRPAESYDSLRLLAEPEFHRVTAHADVLQLLAGELVVRRTTNQFARPKPAVTVHPVSSAVLSVLDALGTNAAAVAPKLLSLMQAELPAGRAVAISFANIAPATPQNVSPITPLLTNHAFVAPLLLWLGGAGTNALAAFPAVQRIAADQLRYPPEAGGPEFPLLVMDPILARRYGLLPRGAGDISGDQNKSKLPSEVFLSADQHCPRRWLSHWPGWQQPTPRAPNNGSAEARSNARRRQPPGVGKSPQTTLARLAEDCLRRLTNGMDRATVGKVPLPAQ